VARPKGFTKTLWAFAFQRKSYLNHTVGMMRIIPFLWYTVVDIGDTAQTRGQFTMTEQDRYQIRVQGWVGERWANWFDGMTMVYEGAEDDSPTTILTGPVVDQAALRGLLARIWDLNLTLLSVTRSEE
jgi:hypothetical protein